ncbi:MAG: hypothetical protein HYY19_03605 [Candidatus Rokubacteria bacterium]|nr:hypothetical protein [Candidatus Rokubacteria bacterium]
MTITPPRPRTLDALTSETFVRLKCHVMTLIREEALRALETRREGEP